MQNTVEKQSQASRVAQRNNAEATQDDLSAAAKKPETGQRQFSGGALLDPRRATSLQSVIGNRAVLRMISRQVTPQADFQEEGQTDDRTHGEIAEVAAGASAPLGGGDGVVSRQLQRAATPSIDRGVSIQRAVTAKKVFKKVGLGLVNFAGETFVGPLVDLKNAIRLIWEHKDPAKKDKVKERVKEEWVGDYGGHTWMKVLHAITTAVEKIGGLAGAIALLATLASIAAPAAAPVAAVAGVIGVVCAGIALIIRSILSGASLHYYKKGETGMKKMAITNLVGAIGNLLGVVSFGVGAGLSGGVNFNAEVATQAGRDIGVGVAFGTSTKVASVTTDVVQSKRIDTLMRADEEKGGADHPNVLMIAKALSEADEVLPDLKKSNRSDRDALNHDVGVMGKLSGKLGQLSEKKNALEAKTSEAESEVGEAESEDFAPTDDEEKGFQEHDVSQMETYLDTADSYADRDDVKKDEADAEARKVSGKVGFFSRLKRGLKKVGKKIKSAFSAIGARVKSAFARFKALIRKIKAKLVALVLNATGLNEKVALATQEFQGDQARLSNEEPANIEENEAKTSQADEKLGEYR